MIRVTNIMVVWANGTRSNHTSDRMVESITEYKSELLEQTPGAVRIYLTYEQEDHGKDKNRV